MLRKYKKHILTEKFACTTSRSRHFCFRKASNKSSYIRENKLLVTKI